MRSSIRYALTIALAASISGCGSLQPPAAQPDAAQVNPIRRSSAQSQDLLYVAASIFVDLVSYPAAKKVGSIYYGLYSYVNGECSDPSGNVWITNYSTIAEYAHGGTKAIRQKFAPSYLNGCSVDTATNDVAAAGQNGSVFVWAGGRGRARSYDTKSSYVLRYCGYDDDGNLFVDGFEKYNNDRFILFELPSGGSKLVSVSLDRKIKRGGQVQWDGRYLAIQDEDAPHAIYEVKVSGSTGAVVNTIALQGLREPVEAAWIDGSTVFVPYSVRGRFANAVGVFKYPAGGNPVNVLHGKTYKYLKALTLSR